MSAPILELLLDNDDISLHPAVLSILTEAAATTSKIRKKRKAHKQKKGVGLPISVAK